MILLDTHALLWMATDPKRLSTRARQAIRRAREQTGIAIAAITLWELAWLAQNNRIVVTGSVESFIRDTAARVILRPITPEIAAQAASLPRQFPRDPADRLIAATALIEAAPLITADKDIRQSMLLNTIW